MFGWHAQGLRRAAAIRCYVGANGSGKSLAMVHDALPSLAAGRPCLSTVQLLVPATDATLGGDRSHPLCEIMTDFRQFLSWRNGDVLWDEVTGVCSSRESSGLPVQVANRLVQLRRDDVTLAYTCPNWARADLILREVTQLVVFCTGHLAKGRSDGDRLWRDRRLSRWRGYDPQSFDKFSSHARDRLKASSKQWFWRPNSVASRSYDTFAPVQSVGVAANSALCLGCGLPRRKEYCPGLKCAVVPDPVFVSLVDNVVSREGERRTLARRPQAVGADDPQASVIPDPEPVFDLA